MSLTRTLRGYGRKPPVDIKLPLAGGRVLQVQQWLRILPGKRLVGRATLDGEAVLVKLFISPAAGRHWQRERVGVEALLKAQIATPTLLSSGELEGGGYYLVSRFLDQAQSLQELWLALPERTPENSQARELIEQVLVALAQMHAQGLIQSDLHLGNFLHWQGQLYVIDGDAVSSLSPGDPITAAQAEENLGRFFAQLPVAWEEHVELLLATYLMHNSHRAINPEAVGRALAAGRQWRLDDYLGKALRDCTLFSVRRNWWRFRSVARVDNAELAPLLDDPDAPFDSAPLLKDGGSSTVARARTAHREVVIKRYNIKGFGHWLRRFWRPSRAWHSWLAAHRLTFLGIATPAPLGIQESRFGPLRRRAWLVTEHCSGGDLLSLFGEQGLSEPEPQQAAALFGLCTQLRHARITHGDFKATNLLWYAGQVWLIDLDAMRVHGTDAAWTKAWAEDRARLIRNWPSGSPLAGWLETYLPR